MKMKLEPIFNPHARINQLTKKSKAEEKDELIEATKQAVIARVNEKKGQPIKGKTTTQQTSGSNNNFQEQKGFKIDEKIDKQTLSIRLLKEGYMQAYVDFFYITDQREGRGAPSYITESEDMESEYIRLKKREKK